MMNFSYLWTINLVILLYSSYSVQNECGRRFLTETFFKPGTVSLTAHKDENSNRIFGGKEADKNSWPWMVLLGTIENRQHVWLCGGTLINKEWVLTAAHCLLEDISIARLGEHNIEEVDSESPPEDYTIKQLIWFPGYQRGNKYHDVALLKLNGIVSSRFTPACLPVRGATVKDYIGREGLVTGWGARSYLGQMSRVLREAAVTIYDVNRCDTAYKKHVVSYTRSWPSGMQDDTILCAAHPLGDGDACQGDSGGPLVIGDHEKYTIVGVVSNGYGCGDKDYPGVYVPIFQDAYLTWILKVAFGITSTDPKITRPPAIPQAVPGSEVHFNGNAYMAFDAKYFPNLSAFKVKFSFKTSKENCLLFLLHSTNAEFMTLELKSGLISYQQRVRGNPASTQLKKKCNDNLWHDVTLTVAFGTIIVNVDGDAPGVLATGSETTFNRQPQRWFLGGFPGNHFINSVTKEGFQGCFKDLKINDQSVKFTESKESSGTTGDCNAKPPPKKCGNRPGGPYPDYSLSSAPSKVESQKHSWPWMALLGNNKGGRFTFTCGGSLISKEWILTAAHCLVQVEQTVVRLGEHNLDNIDANFPHADYPINKVVVFPDYKKPQTYHDMGLVKITVNGQLDPRIQPICLPMERTTGRDYFGKIGITIGFGAVEFGGSTSPILRESATTIFDIQRCRDTYGKFTNFIDKHFTTGIHADRFLCAGHPSGGVDSCTGDAGGPLIMKEKVHYVLVGIISTGIGCGGDKPGIYIPVFQDIYLNWIKRIAFENASS